MMKFAFPQTSFPGVHGPVPKGAAPKRCLLGKTQEICFGAAESEFAIEREMSELSHDKSIIESARFRLHSGRRLNACENVKG